MHLMTRIVALEFERLVARMISKGYKLPMTDGLNSYLSGLCCVKIYVQVIMVQQNVVIVWRIV